jgi:MFS family permease
MTGAAKVYPSIAVLAAVLLCAYSIALETTVVSAAIPTVIQGFGGLSDLSWVFSAYLIAQAVTMPLFGSASDRMGRKGCYAFAAALFFAGTLACGFAWDMLSLIVFRVVQGIGGGGLVTVGTAALNDVIPQSARGKYQAMISAVWGIAAISGPVVGSMIMEFLDWRYIFWINLPMVLVSALLLHTFYRGRASAESDGKLAVLPSMYLCASLLALMAILVHGATLSALLWVVCVAVGGAAAVLLLRAQWHSADPLIPMDLLRMRIVVLAVASAFVCGAIAMGLTVYVPSFVAVVLKADYLTISSTVGVMTLTWTFSGISIGLLIKAGHYRLLATLAGWTVLGGALGLCYVAKSSTGIELVLISSGVLGIGLGACSVIFSVALQSAVADSVRGSATSLFYLSRMLGQSIGVALCAGVIAGSDSLARTVMNQPSQADTAAPAASAEVAAMAGSISSEFFEVFALIAALALVQLVFSLYTPRQATAE